MVRGGTRDSDFRPKCSGCVSYSTANTNYNQTMIVFMIRNGPRFVSGTYLTERLRFCNPQPLLWLKRELKTDVPYRNAVRTNCFHRGWPYITVNADQ